MGDCCARFLFSKAFPIICNLSFFVGLVSAIVFGILHEHSFFLVFLLLGIVLALLSLIFNLSYSFCGNRIQYLRNRITLQELEKQIQDLIHARPVLKIIVECWHFETRVSSEYENGKIKTSYRTVSVTSFNTSKYFHYRTWRDITNPQFLNHNKTYMRVNLFKRIEADEETEAVIKKIEEILYDEHKHRDLYCTVRRSCEFEEKMSEYVMIGPKSLFFNSYFYIFASFFSFNGILELLFDYYSTDIKIPIRKLISIREADIFQSQAKFVPVYDSLTPDIRAPQIPDYNPNDFSFAPQPMPYVPPSTITQFY